MNNVFTRFLVLNRAKMSESQKLSQKVFGKNYSMSNLFSAV